MPFSRATRRVRKIITVLLWPCYVVMLLCYDDIYACLFTSRGISLASEFLVQHNVPYKHLGYVSGHNDIPVARMVYTVPGTRTSP